MLFWLIVSQALILGSLLPWFAVAGLSLTAFNAGFSLSALLLVALIWSYPVFILVCIAIAWWCYYRSYASVSLVSTSVPLLIAVPLLGFLMYAEVWSWLR
ncbi:MAG: hypothetical protein U0822_20285 [Anaerolineae bacterium]